MKLTIYNTLTKQNYEITNFDLMTMYVCGPTLYDQIHIGNGRSLAIFDIFFRFFNHIFNKIIYVRNITDIDDKIIVKSREQNISSKELVDKYEVFFRKDLFNLNIKTPTYEPKVTEFLPEIFKYIQVLLKNEYAYITVNKNIYFDVSKLTNYDFFQNIDGVKEEARVINKDDKKHWKDFVLWKNIDDNYSYESPWGYGRPGWHIECSVMSNHYLGNKFMFHGGGEDLAFPHHHNEIAQNIGFCGTCCSDLFVHNGFICMDHDKMSKSLGNTIYLDELVKDKYSGDIMRHIYISTYYNQNINYTDEVWTNSAIVIDKIREFKFKNIHLLDKNNKEVYIDKLLYLMNIPETLNQLYQLMTDVQNYNLVMNTFVLLGFDFSIRSLLHNDEIENYIQQRQEAKNTHNYVIADEIRKLLYDNFIKIEDTKDNQRWFFF